MTQVGRNSLCPCGSGKKFKKCCLDKKRAASGLPSGGNLVPAKRPRMADPDFFIGQNIKIIEDFFHSSLKVAKAKKWLSKHIFELKFRTFKRSDGEVTLDCLDTGPLRAEKMSLGVMVSAKGEIRGFPGGEFALEASLFLLYIAMNPKNSTFKYNEKENGLSFKIFRSLVSHKEKNSLRLEAAILLLPHIMKSKFTAQIKKFKIPSQELPKRDSHYPCENFDRPSPLPFNYAVDETLPDDASVQERMNELGRYFNNLELNKDISDSLLEEEGIFFQFNDGSLIKYRDIDISPYGALLPFDMLPGHKRPIKGRQASKLQVLPESWFFGEKAKDYNYSYHYYRQGRELGQMTFTNYLGQLVRYVEKYKLPLYMTNANNVDGELLVGQKLIGLNNIVEAPLSSYRLKVDGSTITGELAEYANPEGCIILNEIYFLDVKKQQLVFHSMNELKGLVTQNREEVVKEMGRDEVLSFSYTLIEQEMNSNFLNCLSRDFNAQYGHPLTILNLEEINAERLELQYYLSQQESDKLGVSLKVACSDGDFFYENIPGKITKYLIATHEGVGNLFEGENTDLAVATKGEARKNDLKFLRHGGLFTFLLMECLQAFLDGNDGPFSSAKLKKNIHGKLGHVFKQIAEKEKRFFAIDEEMDLTLVKLKDYCSSKMTRLVNCFVDDFAASPGLNNYLSVVASSSGMRVFKFNFQKVYYSFLRDLIQTLLLKDHKFSFLRATHKNFEAFWSQFMGPFSAQNKSVIELKSRETGILIADRLLPKIIYNPIMRKTLQIDNIPVLELVAEDFSASFHLPEATPDRELNLDWFELNPQIFFHGRSISLNEMMIYLNQDYMEHNGKFYFIDKKNIPAMKWLEYFWLKLQNHKKGKRLKKENSQNIIEVPRCEALDILALRLAGIPVIGGPRWKEICAEFDQLKGEHYKTQNIFSGKFKLPLKDYQKIGTSWLLNLYQLGLGGILADDMGLGKTIQTIGFLELLNLQGKLKKNLIIMPTSLVYNWCEEIKKFAPHLTVFIFQSKEKEKLKISLEQSEDCILLMTYGLLKENRPFIDEFSWNTAIFDEAQNLKNIVAKRTAAARGLKARAKFCLTGTPMENHYGEFYSMIDLCVPGALGTYADFKKIYVPSATAKSLSETTINPADVAFLRLKTSPLVLRRMKETILQELPTKTETVIKLPFERKQAEIYRDIALSWNAKIQQINREKGENSSQLQMFTALLRLRQVCSFPQIIESISYDKTPPKFEMLLAAALELTGNNESILVFTNFKTTLKFLKKAFIEAGIETFSLTGDMTINARSKALAGFNQSPKASILIMTLKTGGVGLNLTKASYVFHIEPWWNPATENQATDRAYRLGQNKKVQVYRYIMQDSVEEKIQTLKGIKMQAFNELFYEESGPSLETGAQLSQKGLTQADFAHLLGI